MAQPAVKQKQSQSNFDPSGRVDEGGKRGDYSRNIVVSGGKQSYDTWIFMQKAYDGIWEYQF